MHHYFLDGENCVIKEEQLSLLETGRLLWFDYKTNTVPDYLKEKLRVKQYLTETGKNALDFQLSSEFGRRLNKKDTFVIVSNDHGYIPMLKYWHNKGYKVKMFMTKCGTYVTPEDIIEENKISMDAFSRFTEALKKPDMAQKFALVFGENYKSIFNNSQYLLNHKVIVNLADMILKHERDTDIARYAFNYLKNKKPSLANKVAKFKILNKNNIKEIKGLKLNHKYILRYIETNDNYIKACRNSISDIKVYYALIRQKDNETNIKVLANKYHIDYKLLINSETVLPKSEKQKIEHLTSQISIVKSGTLAPSKILRYYRRTGGYMLKEFLQLFSESHIDEIRHILQESKNIPMEKDDNQFFVLQVVAGNSDRVKIFKEQCINNAVKGLPKNKQKFLKEFYAHL